MQNMKSDFFIISIFLNILQHIFIMGY
jgi:hypothetical protein